MQNNIEYICVFDCETIPDTTLIKKIYGFDGDDLEISQMAQSVQKEKTGSEFLPIPFHKIVSICAVICDKFGRFIKVDNINGENEEEMVKNFFHFVNKRRPRLVSFNGKGFDMPVLILRALKYNVKAHAYLDTSEKWNNYRTKYAENKHCDLLEILSNFNSSGRMTLDSICSMANLPGKYDISGDKVMELYYNNKLDKINEYCESDTLNTYMLFLKYEFIKGYVNEEDYMNYLFKMSEYLQKNKKERGYTEIFVKACENEIERIKT
ncbi:3'-5' exonuclease [Campylobacter sp. LR264d]|uniref:3'-5' exonuclease n=1 Tax=Campylobacter sp. LR264d TaxID=2593544 RepID=UPI00123B6A45|nr:3'-5' exonuclease [Campylobacter sp. LR264d]KAA6230147.1 3'-5' exonuclease [Campylobacter sp. LR264d]